MGISGDNTPSAKRLMGQKVSDAITLHGCFFQCKHSIIIFHAIANKSLENRFYWASNTGVRTVNL